MQVQIERNYTPAELAEIMSGIARTGLVSAADFAAHRGYNNARLTDAQDISFFCINHLLLPFLDRFPREWKDERDLAWALERAGRRGSAIAHFLGFAQQLLDHCPLRELAPLLYTDYASDGLALNISTPDKAVRVCYETHPGFLSDTAAAVNALLAHHGHDVAYYEVGFDETSAFLPLTASHYNFLLQNRLLRFSAVEYPEVEEWRHHHRLDPLPF